MTEPRELLCMICDREYPTWYALNGLWNRVMRLPDGSDRFPFVCPTCFVLKAVEAGVDCVFELRPAPVIIEGQTFEGGVICGCDCGCGKPLNDGNMMKQDAPHEESKPWEQQPEDAARVQLLICAECFVGDHGYGTCERCQRQKIRRESPTGGWFTVCPTCPPVWPELPQ
jgi:hypothetical protein